MYEIKYCHPRESTKSKKKIKEHVVEDKHTSTQKLKINCILLFHFLRIESRVEEVDSLVALIGSLQILFLLSRVVFGLSVIMPLHCFSAFVYQLVTSYKKKENNMWLLFIYVLKIMDISLCTLSSNMIICNFSLLNHISLGDAFPTPVV